VNKKAPSVKVTILDRQNKIKITKADVEKLINSTLSEKCGARRTFRKRGFSHAEVCVDFINDIRMRELNLLYAGRYLSTDVLSFNNSLKKGELFADIAVSLDTAARNAKIFKTTPLYEAYLYVVHGVLHLLGYDDSTDKERLKMQIKAESILRKTIQSA